MIFLTVIFKSMQQFINEIYLQKCNCKLWSYLEDKSKYIIINMSRSDIAEELRELNEC